MNEPIPAQTRTTASTADVSRFVMECNDAKFKDSRCPWQPLPDRKPEAKQSEQGFLK